MNRACLSRPLPPIATLFRFGLVKEEVKAVSILLLIGKIILGSYFLYAGIHHLTSLEYLTGYAKMKGTPVPKAAVAGS